MKKLIIVTSRTFYNHYKSDTLEEDQNYNSVRIKVYEVYEDNLILSKNYLVTMDTRKREAILLETLEYLVGTKCPHKDLNKFAIDNGYIIEADFTTMNHVSSEAEMINF
jgi:predicted metallo-beta-lactamase superfamily hydrolase